MSAEAKTPTVPTARLMLGGEEREARFTIHSHIALEELTDRPWYDVLAEARLGFSRAIVRLVWSTLQHGKKPPSLSEVTDWMTAATHDERAKVASEVDALVAASLPAKDDKEASEDDPLGEEGGEE